MIHIKIDIKIIWNQWEVAILSQIMFSYCIINAINLNCGGSYIDSPEWIKKQKASIKKTTNVFNKLSESH